MRVRFLCGGLQLASSGSDGLIKIWTIRTNECETTLDSHNDKVWALDLTADGKTMISGGADSQILVYNDTTVEVEEAKRAEEAEAILVDQQLANHLRHKEYSKALNIALERDKPQHALKILSTIIEHDLAKGSNSLSEQVHTWSDEKVVKILRYARDWNTRAINSHIAMTVCKAIFTSFPVHKLAEMAGVAEILAGIIPYAERHFDRLDRLRASSYLLDFALFSMGSLDAPNDVNDFKRWESKSRLVLPPKRLDGKLQIEGANVAGSDNDGESAVAVGYSDCSDE
ncbi:MAG: hypothetical protein JRN15_23780 [Nitrososphaerota archaeon]|nr:hypothetical protein [Nitrososphaerota archaeon]